MTTTPPARSATSRWGWGILIGVSALLALNGVALYFISSQAETFEQDTGVPVEEVEATFPTVVDQVVHQGELLALLLGGMGLIALVLSVGGYGDNARLARNAMWVLALTLAGAGAIVISGDSVGLGVAYLVVAVLVVVGLVLARPGLE